MLRCRNAQHRVGPRTCPDKELVSQTSAGHGCHIIVYDGHFFRKHLSKWLIICAEKVNRCDCDVSYDISVGCADHMSDRKRKALVIGPRDEERQIHARPAYRFRYRITVGNVQALLLFPEPISSSESRVKVNMRTKHRRQKDRSPHNGWYKVH